MKVAIFTDTFMPQVNGVTNTLNRMIEYFKKENIDYLIFAPDSYEFVNENYNMEKFFSLKFFLYPECRVSFPNIFRIKNSLQNFKPDIIHIMTEFNMGLAGMNFGRMLGIPTVSNYSTNFSQYLKYYKLDFLEPRIWSYMRWFHNQNYITVCPSNQAMELLKKHGIPNVKIFSRGIDTEAFNPAYRDKNLRERLNIDNKIVLLYVGRIAPEKDIDILLQSYTVLKDKYKEDISLIITGDGPLISKYKEEFPKDTIFTGYKKGRELAKIYASSDIFVFPSSTETFGNVVLEAMASGLAVVGADEGGVKDIINNGYNGVLFKAKNSKSLYESLKDLIENEELRNSLKNRAQIFAKERSWDLECGRLLGIYKEIIEDRNCAVNKIV